MHEQLSKLTKVQPTGITSSATTLNDWVYKFRISVARMTIPADTVTTFLFFLPLLPPTQGRRWW